MKHTIDLNQIISSSDIRLGVISDTHSRINVEVVGSLTGCDVILHAGDIGDATVLNELKKFTPHVFPVRGNNDVEAKWPAEDHHILANIPEYTEFRFHDESIGLIHGHQYDPVQKRHHKLRGHFPDANIIIYGHSHRFVVDQEETPWVINPGAGGYTRTFTGASCVVMEFKNQQWSINETRL
jgi:putative phosphoesterase